MKSRKAKIRSKKIYLMIKAFKNILTLMIRYQIIKMKLVVMNNTKNTT